MEIILTHDEVWLCFASLFQFLNAKLVFIVCVSNDNQSLAVYHCLIVSVRRVAFVEVCEYVSDVRFCNSAVQRIVITLALLRSY